MLLQIGRVSMAFSIGATLGRIASYNRVASCTFVVQRIKRLMAVFWQDACLNVSLHNQILGLAVRVSYSSGAIQIN